MIPFLIVFIILKIILDCVFLYFIFRKFGIKDVNAFIPFVNVYYYFELCKIPFYTIFVPVVNIIILFFSTYNLVKIFKQKDYVCWISVFVPEVALCYLAFSDIMPPKEFYKVPAYLTTIADLTEINNKLDNQENNEDEYLVIDNRQEEILNSEYISDNIADEVEQNIMNAELMFDDNSLIDEVSSIKVEEPLEVPDTLEYLDDPDDLSLVKNVDVLEKNLEINSGVKREDDSLYKEYKGVGPTDEAIAFGGTKQEEDTEIVKAKVEDLKCSRCGSSLVGATNICPGCGAPI